MEGVTNMKKYLDNKIKMNLQFFAEPPAGDELPPDDKNDLGDKTPPDDKPNLKYSDDDVDRIVKQKLAKAAKEKDDAVEQAKKLAKMNEEDKKQYEFEQLQNELADLKKKDAFYGLSKEASKMLSEHDIQADDDLLAFVVKDSAEDTQTAVNSFVNLIGKKVAEGVKQALAGKSPKVNSKSGQAITKQDIMAEKDATKRIRLIQENQNLFN